MFFAWTSSHLLYILTSDRDRVNVCYGTLEVESSRLAVEALDLSNSIKAFSKR